MLHKCVNPTCSRPFRRLEEGKLFQVETEDCVPSALPRSRSLRASRPFRRVERYWLCDACASSLTLTFERGHGVVLVPLPQAEAAVMPAAVFRELSPLAGHFPLARAVPH